MVHVYERKVYWVKWNLKIINQFKESKFMFGVWGWVGRLKIFLFPFIDMKFFLFVTWTIFSVVLSITQQYYFTGINWLRKFWSCIHFLSHSCHRMGDLSQWYLNGSLQTRCFDAFSKGCNTFSNRCLIIMKEIWVLKLHMFKNIKKLHFAVLIIVNRGFF